MSAISPAYTYTLSNHAEKIEALRLDIRRFLATALTLPTPYKSTDPLPGEQMLGLSITELIQNPQTSWIEGASCQLYIAGAFNDPTGEAALQWADRIGMNLHHLSFQVKSNVDQRDIFYDFALTGRVFVGRPRNPARANGSVQPSSVWIVEASAPAQMKLLIPVDMMSGHLG